nr:DUF2334 domain-containing protein [Corynebacterium ulceribovis]
MTGSLLVSISGIRDNTLGSVKSLVSHLDSIDVPVSLLVAPHIGESWHLAKDKKTLKWVQKQVDAGTPIILNGFDQTVSGRRAEFAALGGHEAKLRLTAANRQMDKLGLATDLFSPPRWQLSPGTLEMLPAMGYRLVGDLQGIHTFTDGYFHRSRVLAMGEGFGAAGWWRRNVIKAAARNAAAGKLVRLSVSGGQLARAKTLRDFVGAIDATLELGSTPATYRDLLD